MQNALLKLLFVSRPISWVNTAFPFGFTYWLLGGAIDMFFIVTTLFFLIPYNLVMYGINDVYDYESDMQNPRKNSIEGAREAKEFHPTILYACVYVLAVFIPAILYLKPDAWFAGWLLLSLFFVMAYSIKGMRFKEKAFLDSITSSLHFTLPLVVALAALRVDFIPYMPYVSALFLWGMASHAFGAVQDIIPDKKGGLSSIATIIGARQTVWLCILLYALAAATLAFQGDVYHAVAAITGLLYIGNIWPYRNVSNEASEKTNAAWRRFIWLNYISGAIITMTVLASLV